MKDTAPAVSAGGVRTDADRRVIAEELQSATGKPLAELTRVVMSLSKQMEDGFKMVRRERIRDEIERKKMAATIGEMAGGTVEFLSQLQGRLSHEEMLLFFELIGWVQEGKIQRVRSYAEIGKRMGVTKQAIQKRYRKLVQRDRAAGQYIKSIRIPEKSKNFSEMSPSMRRKNGIDDCYGYQSGSCG
jgi:predicted transcriptional regulator